MSEKDTGLLDVLALQQANSARVKQQQKDVELFIDALKWMMSDKRGRRFISYLLDVTGYSQSCFTPNAVQMAYNEGCRDVGLRLASNALEHCPERFMELIKERKHV